MSEEISRLFEPVGLIKALQMEVCELSVDRTVVEMPVTPAHHQPMGYMHGGASLALAETAASLAGHMSCPEGKAVLGMEINANHLRAKRSGLLTAVATPLHRGKTSQVWDIRITDEEGRLVCVSRCTLAVVDVRLEASSPGKRP